MAYQHTNRKGVTYHLHRRERSGKTRYVFTGEPGEGAIEAVPTGYAVRESIHGQVSLAKATKRLITTAEETTVRNFLPALCRLEVKGREVIVFEPTTGNARYESVMRFRLLNPDGRTFEVTRRRYSGEGGWTYPLESGTLATLAREFLPHIGKQSFFDLM